MTTVFTIIGQGKMGKALAKRFEEADIPVQLLGREQAEIQGRFVIFAIPYEDIISLIYPNQDYFSNKIIIDISNPLDYQSKESKLKPEQSMTLRLAETFPHLTFLKAFNTNFSSSYINSAKNPLVLIAGNHRVAKEELIKVLKDSPFKPIDVGSLVHSRDLEAFARVQISLFESGEISGLEKFAL